MQKRKVGNHFYTENMNTTNIIEGYGCMDQLNLCHVFIENVWKPLVV